MKIKKDSKLLIKFGFIITLALFASCSNISGSDSSIEQSYEKYSNKTTAEIYIETLFTRDELFTSRNIADYDYPDFFYELDMVDKDGTSIKFEDLTKKEKDVFVQLWKEKITENIEENNQYKKTCPLESLTISSYPQTISSEWEGKANGVQFEPLGLWVGKDQGCCSDVRIYDMQKIVWVWDWFNSGYKPFPADEHDYDLAADYAENSIGIGYGILTKESRNLIYCSALVWQSWRYLNRSYDMSAGFQVTPAEIANSMQTKLITVYYNK